MPLEASCQTLKINQIPLDNLLNTTEKYTLKSVQKFAQQSTLHQINLMYLTHNVFNPKPFSNTLN